MSAARSLIVPELIDCSPARHRTGGPGHEPSLTTGSSRATNLPPSALQSSTVLLRPTLVDASEREVFGVGHIQRPPRWASPHVPLFDRTQLGAFIIRGTTLKGVPMRTEAVVNKMGRSTHLAVFLHGFNERGSSMDGAIAALRETQDGADTDVYAPNLPFGLASRVSPNAVLADLLSSLDEIWTRRERCGTSYTTLTLVGHSMGSLFARKLYAAAMGEIPEAPFENELVSGLALRKSKPLSTSRPWGPATRRIISLAGMNRGWVISHHMSLTRGFTMSIGVAIGRIIQALGGRTFIVMSAQQGAPFITQLRLQWLALRRQSAANGWQLAPVVQLLGTKDDLVPPSANIDPVTGSEFIYLEVPQSGHATVVEMGAEQGAVGALRRAVFQRALSLDPSTPQMVPLTIVQALKTDPTVTDVIFVMHGIRDLGYWTEKIGLRVAAEAAKSPASRKVALETSTYGYFPLLSFLRPGARQEKVEWLMDRVTEAKSRFPNASFSYVGHSHGTYLVAKAMRDYPAVSFKHVVLAGSVLRTDQDWGALLASGRVKKVLNFTASADWVVAFFPNAMQRLRWQDVGGAGHYGFSRLATGLVQLQKPNRFVVGGHSAALDEGWWSSIAEFVLDGNFTPAEMPTSRSHKWWVSIGAAVAPLVWLLIAVAICTGVWLIVEWDVREWIKTMSIVIYFAFLWTGRTQI